MAITGNYRYEYFESRTIEGRDYAFYSLIMAAMRRADTDNLALLVRAFPDVWDELKTRAHADFGLLPGEKQKGA